MGDLFVNASFTPAASNITKPTTRRAIVFVDDPAKMLIIAGKGTKKAGPQFLSLSLKPSNTIITPPTIRHKPTKSKSWQCSLKLRPWWGLRLRKKNRMPAAMPPVGLAQSG